MESSPGVGVAETGAVVVVGLKGAGGLSAAFSAAGVGLGAAGGLGDWLSRDRIPSGPSPGGGMLALLGLGLSF